MTVAAPGELIFFQSQFKLTNFLFKPTDLQTYTATNVLLLCSVPARSQSLHVTGRL